MRYVFDNDLHIHSKISLCSNDPEQTSERILNYAEENGLKTICLTDHYWDENVKTEQIDFYARQNFAHINVANPLPEKEGIKFLFGCETEMDKNMTLGIAPETFEKFDFVVVPTTHFHFTGFTIPESVVTPKQKADFLIEKLNALLNKDLPFHKIGIAHLTCGLIERNRESFLEVISSLSDKDLEAVFALAAKRGVGIELNSDDMKYTADEAEIVLRPYRMAKKCGCKFYMGSDAHHPQGLSAAKEIFEKAIDDLKLTEDDKFRLFM